MKKVVLASFLACAAIASGLPFASAQDAAPAAVAPAAAAASCAAPQMAAAEYAIYNNAMTQTDPKAKAAALEAYLVAYPQTAVQETVLETVMALYSNPPIGDAAKTLDAADRLLRVNPSNIKALYAETLLRNAQAVAVTDAAAKQTALDSAASYATKGLAAPKPTCMSDADFTALKATEYPSFYSVIGFAALNKKDSPTAVDAYKKELGLVPPAATQTPGTVLQDIYYLGGAYMQATPPDYLSCAFYASRAVAYAPDPYKAAFSPAGQVLLQAVPRRRRRIRCGSGGCDGESEPAGRLRCFSETGANSGGADPYHHHHHDRFGYARHLGQGDGFSIRIA